jgi:hypothetical protein
MKAFARMMDVMGVLTLGMMAMLAAATIASFTLF